MKYPKENFEWTDEFVYRVLARGIFPGQQYNIQETKDAVIDAINGIISDAVITPDEEHGGEKLIFVIKDRLVSFPFVRKDGIVIVKSAFYSEKADIDKYKKQRNISVTNKNMNGGSDYEQT